MNRPDSNPELGAILLAAGASTRLGRPKQLVELGGEPLVARAARMLLDIGPACVTVVTGYCAERVEPALNGLAARIVRNDRWEEGMGVSLALGVASQPETTAGAMVLLCDQWRVGTGDLESLLEAWASDISRIAAAGWDDSFGPPVIFPRAFFGSLRALRGDRGAKQVIAERRDRTVFVPMENAGFDLDDEADLARISQA